jgi:hypothetical protein
MLALTSTSNIPTFVMEDVSSLFSNPLFHHVVNHTLKTPLSQSEPVLYDCLLSSLSNFQQIYKNGFESKHPTCFAYYLVCAVCVTARGHSLRGSKATQVSKVLWLSGVRLLAALLSGNGNAELRSGKHIVDTSDVTPKTCYITLNDAGVVVFFMFCTTKQI